MTRRAPPGKSHDGTQNLNPEGIGFWSLVHEDFLVHGKRIGAQGFWVLFWHRFGNWRMGVRPYVLRMPLSALYKVMAKLCELLGGISLPYTVIVGRRVALEHFGGMILIADRIGDEVIIRQNTTFGLAHHELLEGRPTIGDRVDVGAGAVVVGPITTGADAKIGANAVVTRDVPPGAIVGGVPARVIREGGSDDG